MTTFFAISQMTLDEMWVSLYVILASIYYLIEIENIFHLIFHVWF